MLLVSPRRRSDRRTSDSRPDGDHVGAHASIGRFRCPIKHARAIPTPHQRYHFFLDYVDATGYRRELTVVHELRRARSQNGKARRKRSEHASRALTAESTLPAGKPDENRRSASVLVLAIPPKESHATPTPVGWVYFGQSAFGSTFMMDCPCVFGIIGLM